MYEKQFHREIECLIKVKHKNVVRFVGYCANSQGKAGSYNGKFVMADVQQRLLCFEYLPHGTLDKYITDASCGLDWRTRYKIINGICDGLHYLHQNRIVHMDLKPPNILLDDNMSPKIADFGLSRCFDEMQSRAITSKIGGTMGYLAPEFGSREITYLFDLYSLGVIIMEILTGKKGYEAIEDVLESWSNMLEKSHKDMQLEQIRTESCNDGLDNQYINNEGLAEELEKLFERLRISHEFASVLTGGSFEESQMQKNVEACEWLIGAIRCLEVPNLYPSYVNMQTVRDKRAELEKLKITFVRGALEFFRNYFSRLVDSMLNDKSYLYQQRKLKRPDHASLRNKCTTYAHVLQHLKSLDRSCLGPLGKAYCHSLNLLLRQEAREFSIVLRESMKAPNNPSFWLEESNNASQNGSTIDTSTVSDAYSKILTTFIPLLMEEISFFSQFMSFEVPTPFPANDQGDDDLNLLDFDGNDSKEGNTCVKLGMNEALQELLHGIQEDFYVVVDWAYKIDPLCSISMHGITICYLSSQKADAAGFVCKLLDDLQSRISLQFSKFIYEAWHQIKHNERNAHQNGILAYIPRFVVLASRMEQYVQGQSRDLIDKAYTKLVSSMLTTLEIIAQSDPKTADIVLINNYAAFLNSVYDLANFVPTLAKFYNRASESYEQAWTRHISSLIFLQFERLFQFSREVDELAYTVPAEEIPLQRGMSKTDLRRVLKSSLSRVDKSIGSMRRRLQKTLTSDELLPSLWDKCKKEFLDQYESFVEMLTRVYGNEPIMPVAKMRDVLATF